MGNWGVFLNTIRSPCKKFKYLLISFCNISRTWETPPSRTEAHRGLFQGHCCPRLFAHQSSPQHPQKLSLRSELRMCVNLGVLPTKLLKNMQDRSECIAWRRMDGFPHLQAESLESTGYCRLRTFCSRGPRVWVLTHQPLCHLLYP